MNTLLESRVRSAVQSPDECSADTKTIDALIYSQPFEPSAYRLIEVSDALASHILDGGRMYVSGHDEDALTLCTATQTFQAKEVNRANARLIVDMREPPATASAASANAAPASADKEDSQPPSQRNIQLLSVLSKHIELTETPLFKPARFRELLRECQLNIFDINPTQPKRQLTREQFRSALPISEAQANILLEQYPIFTVDGSMYCLSPTGREDLMREFCAFLDTLDSLAAVRENEIIASDIFTSIDALYSLTVVDELVSWMLRAFFDSPNGGQTHKLNEAHVVREVCSHLLRKHAATTYMEVAELERYFYRIVPPSIVFDVTHLRGIGITKPHPGAPKELLVRYLSAENLSLDSHTRLDELFSVAPAWTHEDLVPYVRDFLGDDSLAYDFLAAQCRLGTFQGKAMFYSL